MNDSNTLPGLKKKLMQRSMRELTKSLKRGLKNYKQEEKEAEIQYLMSLEEAIYEMGYQTELGMLTQKQISQDQTEEWVMSFLKMFPINPTQEEMMDWGKSKNPEENLLLKMQEAIYQTDLQTR